MKTLKELIQMYPEAFPDPNGSRSAFPMFGFECGDGWFNLIEPIIKYIHNYNLNNEHKISISQIKEKYGELCIYPSSYTDELDELIEIAESLSSKTCEVCGAVGSLKSPNGWYSTTCDLHTKK